MIIRGKLLDGDGRLVGSGLEIADGKVVRVLDPDPSVTGWITPGFIDIHCHGGGGSSFPDDPSLAGVKQAVDAHRQMGTTAMLASTVSLVDTIPAIDGLATACDEGLLQGIHLEGPYISPHKAGAQNPEAIREPDLDELRQWLETGRGWIKTMTIAPEVAGAVEAAKLLHEYGAVPSWGHTNAKLEATRKVLKESTAHGVHIGLKVPAQTATHLFNAMPPLGHRAPGPVRELVAAAKQGTCVVELIADSVHVHPDLVHDVVEYVGESNPYGVVFVTDAMEGAGMPDGEYVLGGQGVKIVDGTARLVRGGAIAGGTSRMAEQVQRMVGGGYVSMEDAVRCCVGAPARAVGFSEDTPGVTLTWRPGATVNAVVMNDALDVEQVIREGNVL
ncbi:N-acetylglucosamine-6-phosphate deacetylase [Trueperella bialowiezensis]|uniref:N-acetylglucosamine-6-phosphate deacetylase n=1 Tax=Trueperella bialowiezensis TaxID=312285 RepID=A0A448PFM7_9ACTO|nr:amidohydrolase family protein [Trueperella bialowiezensis]VEI13737.1 N-acetylglucosamine-6-phosphate deacetylase [Trueperella bialowiezensis]